MEKQNRADSFEYNTNNKSAMNNTLNATIAILLTTIIIIVIIIGRKHKMCGFYDTLYKHANTWHGSFGLKQTLDGVQK